MDVGSQTEWDARIPLEEIERRKMLCVRRLGMELAPHLMRGPVHVTVSETTEEQEFFGMPRTVYTLLASLRFRD